MFNGTQSLLKSMVGCGYGDCAGGPAVPFVFAAFGLLVASVATFCYGILSAQAEQFVVEMRSATLQLVNDLARNRTIGIE